MAWMRRRSIVYAALRRRQKSRSIDRSIAYAAMQERRRDRRLMVYAVLRRRLKDRSIARFRIVEGELAKLSRGRDGNYIFHFSCISYSGSGEINACAPLPLSFLGPPAPPSSMLRVHPRLFFRGINKRPFLSSRVSAQIATTLNLGGTGGLR